MQRKTRSEHVGSGRGWYVVRSLQAVEFTQVRDHFAVKCCCPEGVIPCPWL